MTSLANSAASGDAQPKAKIFISYSRKDIAFADRLDAALKARGFEPVIDREEIYAFEKWWARIKDLITQADTVVFVLSPDAVVSKYALDEVTFAATLNKRLAPIVCRGVAPETVPELLRELNFIVFDDEARFDEQMAKLAEALSSDIVWIRKHSEFGAQASRWELAGGSAHPGLLLRSPVLEEAEWWIASRPPSAPKPTPATAAFIAESRKQDNLRNAEAIAAQKRKRRLEFAFVGLLILISTAGIFYAVWTNFDYLKLRGEIIADALWPKALSAQIEQSYASMILQPGQIVSFRECARCPEMVLIPKGEFLMGSPGRETNPDAAEGARRAEGPQHKVTFAANFAIAKFELTFDEWKACVDAHVCERKPDDEWGRNNRPVINVSWTEAQRYVKWLSDRVGKPGRYRLLTEAEWEYAARANSQTPYPWGSGIKKDGKVMANCDGCGSQWDNTKTAPAGSFDANAFGLHDMHGNVWEWLQDCESEDYKGAPTDGSARIDGNCNSHIVRGGAWDSRPEFIRSAYRNWDSTGGHYNVVGFRLARTLN